MLSILTNSEKFNKRTKKSSQFLVLTYRGITTSETKDRTIILMTHFISQSAPDIRKKT
jgi:hypothetical protein